MGKKNRDSGISLDSFLDILTCLQGVLMLIIITTGIDAAQTKVVVATPIELAGNERPIYIECRDNQLFRVPVLEARQAVQKKQLEVMKVRRESGGDMIDVLESMGKADIDIGDYVIDFTRYLNGQVALIPKPDIKGHALTTAEAENENTWFGRIVAEMDKDNERINFLVRDDSFNVFKLARVIAWTQKIKVTYSLVPRNDPLIF